MITIDPIKRPPKKSSSVDTTEIMKEVDQKFADLIDGAPDKLNTIKELAEAVANIPKIDNLATKEEIPTKISQLENDTNYATTETLNQAVQAVNSNINGFNQSLNTRLQNVSDKANKADVTATDALNLVEGIQGSLSSFALKEQVYYKSDIDAMLSISKFEWVDLGLPSGLKWATTNVGASKPEEYGLYFAWGETEGYSGITDTKKFNWGDYELCGGSSSTLTKYNNNSSYGTVDNLTTLGQEDDAAYVSDNTCRMPTKADFEELTANTTSTWETLNGVNGRRFTSTNGNSIFVPAAGYCSNGSVYYVGSFGFLQSGSLNERESRGAWRLGFYSDDMNVDYVSRCDGYTVRAVQEANASSVFDPNNYYTKSEVDAKILELQTLINNYIDKNTPEEPTSPNVICTYNVTDISQETQILNAYALGYFSSMIVDGVEMDVDTYYQFDTVGNHVAEYVLIDPTIIGDWAFAGCTSLTSITIPDSVTSIGAAFGECSGLKSFNGKFASEDGRCLIIDEELIRVAPAGLTSYTIPDSVTWIGAAAFYDCSSLTNITIPDGVTKIEVGAFGNCNSLASITCHAPTAPFIESYTFNSVSNDGTLYVPTGSDYSSWMSTSSYYLGYYNWTIQYI